MIKLVLIAWTSLVPPHVHTFPATYQYDEQCKEAAHRMFDYLKPRRLKGVDIAIECRRQSPRA